ncbi:hypothetical protein GCM10010103_16340 [Streptomyces paradoxus]
MAVQQGQTAVKQVSRMPADQHIIREFGRRTYPEPRPGHGGFGPQHVHSGHAVPAREDACATVTALPIRLTHTGLEGRPDRFLCR